MFWSMNMLFDWRSSVRPAPADPHAVDQMRQNPASWSLAHYEQLAQLLSTVDTNSVDSSTNGGDVKQYIESVSVSSQSVCIWTLSFFSICSCDAATPPRNQIMCGSRQDHLQTCIPGSCQRCAAWSGWLHRRTVGCWFNHLLSPLMETGCTSASAWVKIVQNAPLPSGQVGTRHGNSSVIDDLGVSWRISLSNEPVC